MGKGKKKGSGGRRSGGGGRWGVRFDEAAMGAAAVTVGTAVQAALPTQFPDFIKTGPIVGIGLYALGVAFNRKSIRSVGAGMILGQLVKLGA